MSAAYRYQFQDSVPLDDVEASLLLAVWTVESLHGAPHTRLDAGYAMDRDTRRLVLDASTSLGLDLNKVFTGMLQREFPPTSFQVVRVDGSPNPSPLSQAAA